MTNRRAKKSSVRRNTKSFKKVDPFWEENPNKLINKQKKYKELQAKKPKNLESRNKRLRAIAIKSLVKKNGQTENERLFTQQDEFKAKKTKYVRQEGESEKAFKQRMQDDVDLALAEAQMTKKRLRKSGKNTQTSGQAAGAPLPSSGKDANADFRQLIRSELIEQKKITPRKLDLLSKTDVRSSKQHQNDIKRENKNLKKLDRDLEIAEKELFTDKVKFGERVDDIFRPTALPKSVKSKINKEKNLEKMAKLMGGGKVKVGKTTTKYDSKKKNNGLCFLNSEASKNAVASDSLYRRRVLEQERKKAIEGYREIKSGKK